MNRWKLMGSSFALCLAVGLSANAQVGMPNIFGPFNPHSDTGLNENFAYVADAHVVYVNPDPAGPSASGVRLLQAVDPANLAPIAGPPAPDNHYLIVIRPGDYDLKADKLHLPPHVHLLGSGIGVTRIWTVGQVGILGEYDSSIRSLSLIQKSFGRTVAILLESAYPLPFRIGNVEVEAMTDEEAKGILTQGATNLFLRDSRFLVTAKKFARGLDANHETNVDAHGADFTAMADDFTEAAYFDTYKTTKAFFVGSNLAARSKEPASIVTGKDFEGTIRFHASTLESEKTFAVVDGKGKVLIGTTEMTGPYYKQIGSTNVECVHVFDHYFADLVGCQVAP